MNERHHQPFTKIRVRPHVSRVRVRAHVSLGSGSGPTCHRVKVRAHVSLGSGSGPTCHRGQGQAPHVTKVRDRVRLQGDRVGG